MYYYIKQNQEPAISSAASLLLIIGGVSSLHEFTKTPLRTCCLQTSSQYSGVWGEPPRMRQDYKLKANLGYTEAWPQTLSLLRSPPKMKGKKMFTFFLVWYCQPLDQGKEQEDHQARHANPSEGCSSPLKVSRAAQMVILGNTAAFHCKQSNAGTEERQVH